MNISVKAEYALSAIFDLAMRPPGEPVRIADIAKRQHIPQKFLELILASLKQGGFVESRRGAEGGYLLARPAHTIMVGEVMHYVDGAKGRDNRRKPESPFAQLWRRVDDAVSSIVDETSFADLSRAWEERQARYIPNWDI
ncbi:MAG: Rrf2 family transcriptional regulator [Acidobacteria bacterium]|nr:Rrf2 family transcriptional regulator [Acidobacteriota bacterium]